MGCEQLVQHAKVSKNRKFIPHFRENLARPLDKGGVGVVYLPCNSQSAASVRKVINTVNRLIHRVTAEVINPFQQLSTLYRHVVDTSLPPSGAPPLRFTAEPQHCRPVSRCTAHRSTAHRCTVLFASLRRFPAVPQHCRPAFPLYRFSVAPKHLCLFPALPRHRFPAAPFHLCTAALLHRSSLRGSAASPLRRFRPLLLENPFLLFVFSLFRDASPLPFPGCLSARCRLRPATRRPRQRSPRRGGSSPLRTRNPVPYLGSGDSTPGGRIAAPAACRTGTQDGGAGRRRGRGGGREWRRGKEKRGGATLPERNSGGPGP